MAKELTSVPVHCKMSLRFRTRDENDILHGLDSWCSLEVLLDDLQLGQDEVGAKCKGGEEGREAKIPNNHERCEFTSHGESTIIDPTDRTDSETINL